MEEEKLFTKSDMLVFAETCMLKLSSKYEEDNREFMAEIGALDLHKIKKILRLYKK